MTVDLSVVVPVYGCPDSLTPLVDRLQQVAMTLGWQHEVVLVDDACPLGSWKTIQALAQAGTPIIGVRLSRNFGQHSAIEAGLKHASGRWIVVMDCDLQDVPEEIPNLLQAAERSGSAIVLARRARRQDLLHRRVLSNAFYRIMSAMTGQPLDATIANFGVYDRQVIDAYLSWNESQKYFPVMIQWLGFSQTTVNVEHADRHSGKSSYNLRRLLQLGADIMFSFSDRPLWVTASIGLVLALLAVVIAIVVTVLALFQRIVVEGWASLMISVWLMGGTVLAAIGLTGIYVGRVLRESKGRPTYVVAETVTGSTDLKSKEPS